MAETEKLTIKFIQQNKKVCVCVKQELYKKLEYLPYLAFFEEPTVMAVWSEEDRPTGPRDGDETDAHAYGQLTLDKHVRVINGGRKSCSPNTALSTEHQFGGMFYSFFIKLKK